VPTPTIEPSGTYAIAASATAFFIWFWSMSARL
jgi:hypothetical protein